MTYEERIKSRLQPPPPMPLPARGTRAFDDDRENWGPWWRLWLGP